MDHLVIPLDRDHVDALGELVAGAAASAGLEPATVSSTPHITVIAYTGLPAGDVAAAITPVVTATAPFIVHAHGYGFFTGPEPADLSLHVPVVRGGPIDVLHRELCLALGEAGADIAPWTTPSLWSPHITLLDCGLDPPRLGRATTWLAQRHHPGWRIPIDRVAVTGGRHDRDRTDTVVLLGDDRRAAAPACLPLLRPRGESNTRRTV